MVDAGQVGFEVSALRTLGSATGSPSARSDSGLGSAAGATVVAEGLVSATRAAVADGLTFFASATVADGLTSGAAAAGTGIHRPLGTAGTKSSVEAAWAVPGFRAVPKDRITGAIQPSNPRRVLGGKGDGASSAVDGFGRTLIASTSSASSSCFFVWSANMNLRFQVGV